MGGDYNVGRGKPPRGSGGGHGGMGHGGGRKPRHLH